MINFSNFNLPFSVGDLISTSMSLIGLLGGFILLGLVIVFIKPIIWTIRTAIFTHRAFSEYNKEHGERFGRKTLKDTIASTYESGKYKNWGRW